MDALSELWDVSDPYQPLQSKLGVFSAMEHRQTKPLLQYSTEFGKPDCVNVLPANVGNAQPYYPPWHLLEGLGMYLSKSLQFHGFSLATDTSEVLQESFHAQSSCFAPGFMGNCEMRFSQDFWGVECGI